MAPQHAAYPVRRRTGDHRPSGGHPGRLSSREPGGEPAGHHGVRDRADVAGGQHRGGPVDPALRRSELGGRAEQREPVHPFRGVRGEPGGHHPAEREADVVRPLDAEPIQQREHVGAEVGQLVRARRHRGLAVTPVVVPDHPEPFGERRQLRLPHGQGAAQRAAQHDDRGIRWPRHDMVQRGHRAARYAARARSTNAPALPR